MGRRKIEMKMVKDSSSRQVTFSKRRTGLFKKANELATLCAAEVAIVVFSPGGKPFSFGHPSVEEVADRFLNQDAPPKHSIPSHPEPPLAQDESNGDNLNQQLSELLKQLEIEKQKGERLEKEIKAGRGEKFQKPVNELSLDELLDIREAMESLQDKLRSRVNEMEASSSLLLLSQNPVRMIGNQYV